VKLRVVHQRDQHAGGAVNGRAFLGSDGVETWGGAKLLPGMISAARAKDRQAMHVLPNM